MNRLNQIQVEYEALISALIDVNVYSLPNYILYEKGLANGIYRAFEVMIKSSPSTDFPKLIRPNKKWIDKFSKYNSDTLKLKYIFPYNDRVYPVMRKTYYTINDFGEKVQQKAFSVIVDDEEYLVWDKGDSYTDITLEMEIYLTLFSAEYKLLMKGIFKDSLTTMFDC